MKILDDFDGKTDNIIELDTIKNRIYQELGEDKKKLKINIKGNWKIIGTVLFFLGIIAAIIWIVLKNKSEAIPIGIDSIALYVFICQIPAILAFLIASVNKDEAKEKVQKFLENKFLDFNILRVEVFIYFFNNIYSDIKVVKKLNKNNTNKYLEIFLFNSFEIFGFNPSIKDVYPGYQLQTKNNVLIDCFIFSYVVSVDDEGRENIADYFVSIIRNVDERFLTFDFRITPNFDDGSNILMQKNTMENNKFNKNWFYRSNDLVGLREILTPWTQEKLANSKIKYDLIGNTHLVSWSGKYYFVNNLFSQTITVKKTIDETVSALAQDIKNDFEIFQNLIRHLSAYKRIIF